jgi:DNA (cytosine-5)-methyltransferase 1
VTLRLLDLFSGIGGFSYAAERLIGGFQTVQFVEREPFCQKILRKHWPNVPIHDDICTFSPEPNSADVICGGFPCQDISTAGKRAGIKQGTRSGLFFELIRVVRVVRPRFVVLENVAAILTDGLGIVLGKLAEAGYDAEWTCIRASDVGACHRRDRWWCVAYSQSGRRREGQGQGTGQAGHERQGVGDDAAGSTSHSMRDRLEGAHQLGGSWTQWPAAPARLVPDWRSYLSEPVIRRGDARLSGRMDRLKALGNAVVPQVAAIPLARVLELSR